MFGNKDENKNWKLNDKERRTVEITNDVRTKSHSNNHLSKYFLVSIISLLVTIISLIRIPYVGVFLDDVFFTFPFGWGKYIIYALLIFIEISLFTNNLKNHFDKFKKHILPVSIMVVSLLWIMSWIGGAFLPDQTKNLYSLIGFKIVPHFTSSWLSNSIFKSNLSNQLSGYFMPYMGGGMIGYLFHGLVSYATSLVSLIIAILLFISGLSYLLTGSFFGFYKKALKTKGSEPLSKNTTKKSYVIDKQLQSKEVTKNSGIKKSIYQEEIDRIAKEAINKSIQNEKRLNNLEKTIEKKSVPSDNMQMHKSFMPSFVNVTPYGTKLKTGNTEELLNKQDKEEIKHRDNSPLNNYVLPSNSLLTDDRSTQNMSVLKKYADEKANVVVETLKNFDINVKKGDIHISARIISMEFSPEANTKLNKLLSFEQNLKLALATKSIRMQIPIPGKSVIGIEIPNIDAKPIYFKQLLDLKRNSSPTNIIIGQNSTGELVEQDIVKTPHLLIAGSTGSGKSVFIASIILSVLFNAKPNEVKLLLVDPKKVELSTYSELPHLICPIITDAKEATKALEKLVSEMDNRYSLFQEHGVKNIEMYNMKVKDQKDKLPIIIAIIDELADLMMVSDKEVEASIMRITQLARAAGIHLVVATQRPSVDIITGVIKSNIPTRIAFSVSSQVDSRTILDRVGAEELLGKGDMLFSSATDKDLVRLQAAFIPEEDIMNVTSFCKKQGTPSYWEDFTNFVQTQEIEDANFIPENDLMYKKIKKFVITTRKASASFIQRHFDISYIKASKYIDALEAEGIVGPQEGNKPREIFV